MSEGRPPIKPRKIYLNNQDIRAALQRHWEAAVALDLDRAHDIYHDDVIVEFPQSGEHFCTNKGSYIYALVPCSHIY
ncbi:MAG: hypothetical protein ACRD8Z_27770 [Nitrososphaeraceae archaeon]